jgi:hypothetical protein
MQTGLVYLSGVREGYKDTCSAGGRLSTECLKKSFTTLRA